MDATTIHHGEIVIEGPKPMTIDPTTTKRRPALGKDEARMLTDEIQRTVTRLWLLVTEAHDRAAHFALGYESWDDYVRGELKMSPSRSYQLLDTGHVMRALAEAGANIEAIAPPPARVVAKIKDRLPEVRKVARAATKSGEAPDKALRELARQPRERRGEEVPVPQARSPQDEPPATGRRIVTCPACSGEGKVTRSLGNRLRAFMKNLEENPTA